MSMWGQERCDHVGLCSAIFNPDYPDLGKIRSGFVFDSCSVGQCRGHVGPTWDLCICWAYVGPLGPCWGMLHAMLGPYAILGQERRVHLGLVSRSHMNTPFLGHVGASGPCWACIARYGTFVELMAYVGSVEGLRWRP